MIPLSAKLINHLVEHYGYPQPTKDETETTLNRVYGHKVAELLVSGELSTDDYVSLASPDDIDEIEMIKSGCLYED